MNMHGRCHALPASELRVEVGYTGRQKTVRPVLMLGADAVGRDDGFRCIYSSTLKSSGCGCIHVYLAASRGFRPQAVPTPEVTRHAWRA